MIRGIEFHQIIGGIFDNVSYLGEREQLKCDCPRCYEEGGYEKSKGKKNLEINTHKRQFHCWSCSPQFSGSLGKLIYLYGNKAQQELYKSYAASYPDYQYENEDEIEYQPVRLPEEFISFSKMDASNPDHFEAYNHLINERKKKREIILKYKFGFCVDGKYKKRIIIPSYDEFGMVNYFIARTYDKKQKIKYLNPDADKNKIIFNDGFINWDSMVTIVEGAFDMSSVPNSIPMLGKTLSTKLFLKLKKIKPNVLILLDPDAYKTSVELYYMLKTIYVGCEERVKIVKLSPINDIDEIEKYYGIDEVINCLYSARNIVVDDYFISKLQKPYVKRTTGRYESNRQYINR